MLIHVKPFWTGTLRFGQIAIPVGIASSHQADRVDLTVLHRDCATKIERRPWCPGCDGGEEPGVDGRLVADEHLVRAFEVARGQYVQVSDEELAALDPADTRTIEITHVCPAGQLDDLAVDAVYFLTPSEAPMGRRPYELVRRALSELDGVAVICRAVVRKHEWVCRLRPHRDHQALVLEKLHPAGTDVDTSEIAEQLASIDLTQEEIDLARELITRKHRRKLPAGALKVTVNDRRRELLDAKLAAGGVTTGETKKQTAELPGADLSAALTKSLRKSSRRPKALPEQDTDAAAAPLEA